MKNRRRYLLIIMPLLPLLMANSPAPKRNYYQDLEITYLSTETLHTYNFYHFNVKNTGSGYVNYLSLSNKNPGKGFYASIENNEICPPFANVVIEPGFDKELVFATKYEIPESKEVTAEVYDYYVAAENITFISNKEVTYSVADSYPLYDEYIYTIDAQYDGELSDDYSYDAVIKLTYDGVSCSVCSGSIDKLYIRSNESLDLTKLTVDEITMVRNPQKYSENYYFVGCRDVANAFGIFLLVFFLLMGFGVFAAIFFPAMARRRRRRALLEQNNK